ncbi:MAG: hypothetical protein QN157_08940 [Armatimonadota bacterium]|nr:hypothetical protein [Armatimonadota bacterium]
MEGQYPDDSITLVKYAHDLAKQGIRSLARRVLRLYIANLGITSGQALRALRRLSGEMNRKQPRRKLRMIAQALDEAARYAQEQAGTRAIQQTGRRWSDIAWPLNVRRWRGLLKDAEPHDVGNEEFGLLRLSLSQIMGLPQWEQKLQGIPSEERLLILFVLWLARKRKDSARKTGRRHESSTK